MTGASLCALHADHQASTTLKALRFMGVKEVGLALEFHYHLSELLKPPQTPRN
jgi:hypothetical protein